MKLRHPIIEVVLAALALGAILYLLAKGHLPPPFAIGGQRSPVYMQLRWYWQGCWLTPTATPFSSEEVDFVCAV